MAGEKWKKIHAQMTVEFDIRPLCGIRGGFRAWVEEVMEEAADRAVKRAKELVPVRTGRLKKSIGKERLEEYRGRVGGEIRGWIVTYAVGDTEAYYGLFVEMGTRHMAAQPFLKPAIEEARAGLGKDIKTSFRVFVDGQKFKTGF